MKRESIYERECASYGSVVGASVVAYPLPRYLNISTSDNMTGMSHWMELPIMIRKAQCHTYRNLDMKKVDQSSDKPSNCVEICFN